MKVDQLIRLHFLKIIYLFAGLSVITFIFKIGGSVNSTISGLLYGVTFYLCLLPLNWIIKIFGKNHPKSKGFKYLFWGALLAGVASTFWVILLFIPQISSENVTTLLFFAGYLLTFAGFIIEIKTANIQWRKSSETLLSFGFVLLLAFIFYVSLLESRFMFISEGMSAVQIVDISFVIGDFFLIALSGFLLRLSMEYKGGLFSTAWLHIFLGMLLIAFADLFLVPFNAQVVSDVWPYNQIKTLWVLANLLTCLGFYEIWTAINKSQEVIRNHKQE